MQLNSIELISYDARANEAKFVLDCGLADALALDGETLTITSGEKEVAVFAGYGVTGVEIAGEYVRMTACRKLDEATAAAIEGLDANVLILSENDKALDGQISALVSAFQEV